MRSAYSRYWQPVGFALLIEGQGAGIENIIAGGSNLWPRATPCSQAGLVRRNVAIAIPARNEAGCLPPCLARIAELRRDARVKSLSVRVVANNCTDDSAHVARTFAERIGDCQVLEVDLPADLAHAGGARRIALDAAAAALGSTEDVILSTDADTVAAFDWLVRTLDYLDQGYDAVAGRARFDVRARRRLPRQLRRRLAAIRAYEDTVAYLDASRRSQEPWPRHRYEGGASMALTLGVYRAIGGAPTPPLGEDRALFDAVTQAGGRVRHPTDVRVATTPRLTGRARGGESDTLALWSALPGDAPIEGLLPIDAVLGRATVNRRPLSFDELPAEVRYARSLVAAAREARRAVDSPSSPQVEAIGLPALRERDSEFA
jgi:cellulose synthase/poly-beta-1,6-N-acetylglucosamine synthase-like glycosyltransferase